MSLGKKVFTPKISSQCLQYFAFLSLMIQDLKTNKILDSRIGEKINEYQKNNLIYGGMLRLKGYLNITYEIL